MFAGVTEWAESNLCAKPYFNIYFSEQFHFGQKMLKNLVLTETRDGTLKSFQKSF